MALIKCPECGREVSNKATTCIHCGTPLIVEKKVKVKIPPFCTGMFNQKATEVEVFSKKQCLWKGYSGSLAIFELEGVENVSFLIKKAYTGHPFPFFKDFTIDGMLQSGKKYEIKCKENSLLFGDPTKSKYVFSEVEVIDSTD